MNCPKCNKKVSELEETCPFCGISFEEYEEKQQESEQKEDYEYGRKTLLLKFIMWAQLIGCIISSIVLWNNEETGYGFIVLFVGIIVLAFIKGFTDIIDLLDSINNK